MHEGTVLDFNALLRRRFVPRLLFWKRPVSDINILNTEEKLFSLNIKRKPFASMLEIFWFWRNGRSLYKEMPAIRCSADVLDDYPVAMIPYEAPQG